MDRWKSKQASKNLDTGQQVVEFLYRIYCLSSKNAVSPPPPPHEKVEEGMEGMEGKENFGKFRELFFFLLRISNPAVHPLPPSDYPK